MTIGLAGFVRGYANSAASTEHRIEFRNIGQGGNHTLLAGPLAMQATWAGFFMADVASVVTGPFSLIAQVFRIAFHPLISIPVSIVSSAVRSGLYESSISTTLKKQTRYFARGAEAPALVPGSVSLEVDGKMRHFMLGHDMTHTIENSALVEVDGKTKRYYVYPLRKGEECDAENCREIEWKGKKTTVKLCFEVSHNYIQQSVNGETHYYKLGNEVTEPVKATIAIYDPKTFSSKYYTVGKELQKETAGCIKVEVQECPLYYDTGTEIDTPTDTSHSFVIDGTLRHFASAKYAPDGASLGLSGVLNKIPRLPVHAPTRLSKFSIRVLLFINENMSNIIRVALVSASVALVYFGSMALAAGAILAVSYEYLNHDLGIVPKKVALFMEKWMPTISMVGLLIVGSFMTQISAGITLLLTIPSVNLFVQQKLANQIRKVLLTLKDFLANMYTKKDLSKAKNIKEFGAALEAFPRLEECDAPLVQKNGMALSEIEAILNAEEDTYEINPAHLTKDFRPPLNLPVNRNFNELIRLWDTLEKKWLEPRVSMRLFKRLIDDKRFIQFVRKRFPEAKIFHYEKNWRLTDEENRNQEQQAKKNHSLAFEGWIRTLALEKKSTSEAFIAHWIREQLQHYIDKLTGKRPIEGEHRFLEETIENTAKLIPFLLDPKISTIDLEDKLLQLAIEAGDYCALGSWRTSRDALESFTTALPVVDAKGNPLTGQEAFANNVYLTLQKARLRSIDAGYQMVFTEMRKKEELRDLGEDIHTHTALTRMGKRGFYPLEANDMREFGLSELVVRETAGVIAHMGLLRQYKAQIPELMRELGIDRLNEKKNHVLTYLRTWVQENQVLSLADKQKLLKGALAETKANFEDYENFAKWNRLMLTILGVVRQKRAPQVG